MWLPNFADCGQRHALGRLVQPQCGLVRTPRRIANVLREPALPCVTTPLGDLTFVRPGIRKDEGRSGIGSGADGESAWVRAVAEACERYATLVWDEHDFTVASARELGQDALDLDRIPHCSPAELADPDCLVSAPDKTRPIRWAEGRSLISGRRVFVPAIMVHLSMVPWEGELFWLQISTGVAAHTDPAAALVSAICESVERDAIALTWLCRRRLPRLPGAATGTRTACAIAKSGIAFHAFDATTDLGVPTVLSVQTARTPGEAPISMSCATAPDLATAAEKALREAVSLRTVLYYPRDYPGDPADFTEVIHGAAFYADGNRPEAFDFLLSPARDEVYPAPRHDTALAEAATQEDALVRLAVILKAHGMEAVAVDLTTDELRDCGLWVVRVVIPELQPLSFVHRARFLGTPRLVAALAEGFGGDASVNPDPVPFA